MQHTKIFFAAKHGCHMYTQINTPLKQCRIWPWHHLPRLLLITSARWVSRSLGSLFSCSIKMCHIGLQDRNQHCFFHRKRNGGTSLICALGNPRWHKNAECFRLRTFAADKIPEGNVCEGQKGNIAVREKKIQSSSESVQHVGLS